MHCGTRNEAVASATRFHCWQFAGTRRDAMSSRGVGSILAILCLAASATSASAQTVLQWNLRNTCAGDSTCLNNEVQFIANLKPRPSIVTVQELPESVVSSFVSALNLATSQTWDYVYSLHKGTGKNGDCNAHFAEGVAILTTYTIDEREA